MESNGLAQPGYAQNTSIQPTTDVGLTFQATMANPFHQGVIEPAGNSNGPNTFLGQGLPRVAPLDFENPQNMRYSVGMQRELLKIARETLHEVREINRKTPDLQPG